MRRHDLWVAVLALVACAVAFGLTYRFTTTTPAAMMQGMGAEFFPRLVIGLIMVLAVCIGLGIGNPPTQTPPRIPGIVFITAGVLAAYVVAVELFGMWITSFALMMGLGHMWGERRYARMAIASVGMLLAIWCLFVKVLKSGFPAGLIERLWS